MVRVLVCMVGPCVEAVVQPRLRMDLLQDMAGSTAAAAARALDHRRQKAQNLPWSKNVETFTKLDRFFLYTLLLKSLMKLGLWSTTNLQMRRFPLSPQRERESSSCTAGVAVIGLSCLSSAVHGGWSTLGKPGPHCSQMMMQSPMKLPGQPKA